MSISMLKTNQTTKVTVPVGTPVPLRSLVASQPDSWVQGYVSLDQFHLPYEGTYDGFWWQVTNSEVVEVYFDDIYVEALTDTSHSPDGSGCGLTLSANLILIFSAFVMFGLVL